MFHRANSRGILVFRNLRFCSDSFTCTKKIRIIRTPCFVKARWDHGGQTVARQLRRVTDCSQTKTIHRRWPGMRKSSVNEHILRLDGSGELCLLCFPSLGPWMNDKDSNEVSFVRTAQLQGDNNCTELVVVRTKTQRWEGSSRRRARTSVR